MSGSCWILDIISAVVSKHLKVRSIKFGQRGSLVTGDGFPVSGEREFDRVHIRRIPETGYLAPILFLLSPSSISKRPNRHQHSKWKYKCSDYSTCSKKHHLISYKACQTISFVDRQACINKSFHSIFI